MGNGRNSIFQRKPPDAKENRSAFMSCKLQTCLSMIQDMTVGDFLFDSEGLITTPDGGVVAGIETFRIMSRILSQDDTTSLDGTDDEEVVNSSPPREGSLLGGTTRSVLSILHANKRRRLRGDGAAPGSESWSLCPVCLDSAFEMGREDKRLVAAKCGHLLCAQCMQAVLSDQKRCPQCRRSIKVSDLRSIYC